ncbi:g3686 [Coccomyxa viridis]|uniref:phosphoribosylamine--glycine ligase n=1 Tax=Coccomyxa viridis TaxID=1274662 RepID=A0ABP1FNE0_9CHLO
MPHSQTYRLSACSHDGAWHAQRISSCLTPFLKRGLYRCRIAAQAVHIVAAADSKVNVLLVGGGGREHALAWKLAQSPQLGSLFCAPGNPGISAEPGVASVADLDVDSHEEVVRWCQDREIGLVLVGPEAPLVAGLVDSLKRTGIRAFGPSAAAAQLEGSKAFLKDLCREYNIPTGTYEVFRDPEAAKGYIREQGAPIVVKAVGLAAGKGVVVARTVEEAAAAVDDMLVERKFGEAGSEVVVEEFLDGEEASFFALIDGESCVALASAQDHKAVGEGDTGPNTGGMGAYSPAPVVTPEIEAQVMEEIVQRTASAMVDRGIPFSGVLFAGLMIKNGKARLLEHNVRFGDPECQCLMMRLQSDLLEVLLAAAEGRLGAAQLQWSPEKALTVVLAAKGYPGSYKKGSSISSLGAVKDAKVFHAGTSSSPDGGIIATGGRVLAVTALADTVALAQQKAYKAVDQIHWPEGFCRRDIGWRAVERER